MLSPKLKNRKSTLKSIKSIWGRWKFLYLITYIRDKYNIHLSHYPEYPGPTSKNTLRLLYRAGIFRIVWKRDISWITQFWPWNIKVMKKLWWKSFLVEFHSKLSRKIQFYTTYIQHFWNFLTWDSLISIPFLNKLSANL